MTNPTFVTQMGRLTSVYGPKAYPKERVDLIWNEFRFLSDKGFETVISRLIAENNTPPMLGKFREIASSIREREWGAEKKQHAHDAKQFGSIANHAEKFISFTEYVVRAVNRNEPEEMKDLIKAFGTARIEKILAKHQGGIP